MLKLVFCRTTWVYEGERGRCWISVDRDSNNIPISEYSVKFNEYGVEHRFDTWQEAKDFIDEETKID